MGFAPATVVDGPPRLPLPYGLFSVVSLAEATTERWENGVEWEAISCEPAAILVGDCNAPIGFPKQFPDGSPIGEASAFTVYGTYKCNPIGSTLGKAQEKARAVLAAREEQAAERWLWAQLDNDPTLLTGGDPLLTLASLEKWLADNYGSLGVLHMSRWAATILAVRGLIEAKGNQMLTRVGTPVVVGSGYPGTGPGIDETQTVTMAGPPTAGTFTLTYYGQTTAPIAYNATAGAVADALNALDGLPAVTATGGPLPGSTVTLTFDSDGENVPQLGVDGTGLTGGTVAVATTVEGSVTQPPADNEYIAASPALFGYRSQVFEQTNREGDLLDTRRNDLYGIAERNYLLGMDPCGVAMAPINLGA